MRKPRPDFSRWAAEKDIEYKYPKGLDLEPGSEQHERLLQELLDRADMAKNSMQNRYDSWSAIDEKLTSYIWIDDEEAKVREEDDRKPVTVVVPTMYATLDILMTYMTAAFMSDMMFPYEAIDSGDEIQAAIMEQVINNQVKRAKLALPISTAWRDSFVYGFGVSAVSFGKTMGTVSIVKKQSAIPKALQKLFGGSNFDRERVQRPTYEGNFIGTVDPYSYLPDPNVPVYEVQKGEFTGWVDRSNLVSLLREEQGSESDVFNCQYLDSRTDWSSNYFGYGDSGRSSKNNIDHPGSMGVTTVVDIMTMFVDMIPSDWGLGDSHYPEKWLFRVAGDSVIIQASPMNLDHGRFPVCVACPDFDGHTLSPISRLETVFGLQETVDWLFRSHVANVRKAVNDMIVYDPWVINSTDISNPGPGKLIRTRRAAWGKDLRESIVQLNINDITRANVQDVAMIKSIMDESTGTIDAVKGLDRSGSERVSATEAGGRMKAALSRMERIAKVIGLQYHSDLGYMMASHTRQLMSAPTYVRVYGDLARQLGVEYGKTVEVGAADIDVDLDIRPTDGSLPGAKDASAWMQFLPIFMQNPVLMQQFDMVRIVKHVMRGMGASNVDQFEMQRPVNMQSMPMEQIDKNIQAGNMIPMGGANV